MPFLCTRKCKFEGHIYNEGEFYDGSKSELPKHFKEVGVSKTVAKKTTTKGAAK